MSRKVRVSYVLDEPTSPMAGHRLGVNALALDTDRDVLFSAGRDGLLCAWDLTIQTRQPLSQAVPPPLSPSMSQPSSLPPSRATLRYRHQAHSRWANDLAWMSGHQCLVSASSDLTVQAWRPYDGEGSGDGGGGSVSHTLGFHKDHVKCLAAPVFAPEETWVASGSLDRTVEIWDVGRAASRMCIDVRGESDTSKGSVYALAANRQLVANGGPESIVYVWDVRSGEQVAKYIGHTDLIRAILINEAGDTLISASSDQTIKVWNMHTGRCLYTLTMHSDSVWAMFSSDPTLHVFVSADRSGLVARTDIRQYDAEHVAGEGQQCLALAQQDMPVSQLVCRDQDHMWTTAGASIHHWQCPPSGSGSDNEACYHLNGQPFPLSQSKLPLGASSPRLQSPSASATISPSTTEPTTESTSTPATTSTNSHPSMIPLCTTPVDSIHGKPGLLNYRLLSDRRRVLTVDSSGHIQLWDLLKGEMIRDFPDGCGDVELAREEVETEEVGMSWCSLSMSMCGLEVVLDGAKSLEAGVYLDTLSGLRLPGRMAVAKDQRIGVGKLVLTSLFADLVAGEVERDRTFRQQLAEQKSGTSTIISGEQEAETMTWTVSESEMESVEPVEGEEEVEVMVSVKGEASDSSKMSGSTLAKRLRKGIKFGKRSKAAVPSTEQVSEGSSADLPIQKVDPTRDVVDPDDGSVDWPEDVLEDSMAATLHEIRQHYRRQSLSEKSSSEGLESQLVLSPLHRHRTLPFPASTHLFISEETSAGEWRRLYSGTLARVRQDADAILSVGPRWLGEYLFRNSTTPFVSSTAVGGSGGATTPTTTVTGKPDAQPRISFSLLPSEGSGLPLIPMQSGGTKVMASGMIRVRRILEYIAEQIDADYQQCGISEDNREDMKKKVDKETIPSTVPSTSQSNVPSTEPQSTVSQAHDASTTAPQSRAAHPETYLELLCHETILPPTTTLMTVRARHWLVRTGDIVLHYRLKASRPPAKASLRDKTRGLSQSLPMDASVGPVEITDSHASTLDQSIPLTS